MRVVDDVKLRKLIADNFLNLTELAREADLSLVTVMRTANGKNNPSVRTLKKICKVLGCEPKDIIKEVNENE